jgi:hypothetical protein
MQAVCETESISCTCASIGNTDGVRLCSVCHRYWNNDKELVSVGKVIKTMWPFKPDFSQADPAVIENARERGSEVDRLFSLYVVGGLDRIPKGTRQDSFALFAKLRRYWDRHKHGNVRSQVILADEDIAGTCDILDDDDLSDVKCTYDIEPVYPLQLAAYGELHFATFKRPVKSLNIIHVTKRYAEPKIIKIDFVQALEDWMILRQAWRMVQRRTA